MILLLWHVLTTKQVFALIVNTAFSPCQRPFEPREQPVPLSPQRKQPGSGGGKRKLDLNASPATRKRIEYSGQGPEDSIDISRSISWWARHADLCTFTPCWPVYFHAMLTCVPSRMLTCVPSRHADLCTFTHADLCTFTRAVLCAVKLWHALYFSYTRLIANKNVCNWLTIYCSN